MTNEGSKFYNKNHNMDYWVSRWDTMQEYYNPDRKARFDTIIFLLKSKIGKPRKIIDLGCGTGSIMLECLLAFPDVHVTGIDFDITLLNLAKERLKGYSSRAAFLQTDLREVSCFKGLENGIDAILSATALHWLSADELEKLYEKIFTILKKGGIFLNADHVGSIDRQIQESWDNQKKSLRQVLKGSEKEPWPSFWEEYLSVLGDSAKIERNMIQGQWKGIEQGLPLDWQFSKLKKAGFTVVDCFYRYYSDAIYGGIKE